MHKTDLRVQRKDLGYISITIIVTFLFLSQGNFSYFWIKKDYSLFRLLRMMFRLNFLVVMVMAVTNHEFVRYYVCAMHTYWFLTVYIMMAIFKSHNEVKLKTGMPKHSGQTPDMRKSVHFLAAAHQFPAQNFKRKHVKQPVSRKIYGKKLKRS